MCPPVLSFDWVDNIDFMSYIESVFAWIKIMPLPIVAIVGRPNVGKSTLFNRIIGRRKAVTAAESGVTRDRHIAEAEWAGRAFLIMDTGGWVPASSDIFEEAIREQVEFALDECDLVLFVGDAQTGPTDVDTDIARILHRSKKALVFVVNKVDSPKQEAEIGRFYSLGLGESFACSAVSGRGVAEVLDKIIEQLPQVGVGEELTRPHPRIAIVGRPNVGKSSLVNALLGKPERVVTPIPGTTRDSLDSVLTYYGQKITLIDTAGLRRRTKVKEAVEFFCTLRSQRAIRECDVAAIMVDASDGVVAQDVEILDQAAQLGKGLIFVMNKWDLIEKDARTADRLTKELRERLATYDYVPILFVSALERMRIHRLLEIAMRVFEERQKRVATSELNRFLGDIMKVKPPPAVKGKDMRQLYLTQVEIEPPTFIFFSHYPNLVYEPYKRFLEHRLRESYGFEGVPLRLKFQKK
jgi:GTP-binding protein